MVIRGTLCGVWAQVGGSLYPSVLMVGNKKMGHHEDNG